jgi:nucleotide-binding universal stress UspA family protein
MKVLIPVDCSAASLAPVEYLAALVHRGEKVEALVLNVQPRFHRHVTQFTSRAARDTLRAERSREAMASALERLAVAGVPARAMSDIGSPAERIAQVAERHGVDEIMMGVGRHPAWLRWINPSIAQGVMARTDIPVTVFNRGQASAFERYGVPAGAVGLAALLLAAE